VRAVLSRRPARRLLFALAALVAVDLVLPGCLHRLEAARYESDRVFRFENSDLFSLGPLVQYLREHPRGRRPRVVFFGNSIVWGYFLKPDDTLPAQFQKLDPGVRVFNMAINGFETGNAYLITKRIIDSVDSIYLFYIGGTADPMLPQLVAVDPDDLRRFALAPPDPVESRLEALLGFWRLYRDAYRVQAALFGTSMRQYVYLHKTAIPGQIWRAARGLAAPEDGRARAEERPVRADLVEPSAEMAPAPATDARRRQLAAAYPLLWDYAELVHGHRKHAVVVKIRGYSPPIAPADLADLNATFRPHVLFLEITIPKVLTIDGGPIVGHPSEEGARAIAQALLRHAPPLTAGRASGS
jgi:hypothetical protein